MADVVGICNSALAKIGAARIVSLTEGSKNANACAEQYDKLRDDLLRGHAWNFAIRRVKLARLAEAPAFGFAHAYQLPADWLRTVSAHDEPAARRGARYRIEGRRLLSGAEAVYLRYVARVADPNAMPPDFREALAALLGRELAVPLAQSVNLQQVLDEQFRRRLRRARSVDAVEDVPDDLPPGRWVAVRG